ncbi:MAG: rubrerythrin family protein [Deltaproteobacteria bacterium]|nr:rubrerythrin family protein [Deltaproteobacteria bacterium]
MKTKDNLQAAFAGESQANRKYLVFAKKADQEKFPQIARLFRAAAEAETIHAHAHLRNMAGIGSTLENLKTAVSGEGYEYQTMYPEFLAVAEEEGQKAAAKYFNYALEAEKIHFDLYSAALKALENGSDLPERSVYVCPVCGHTVYDVAPDKCPICGVGKDQYFAVA